MTLNVVPIHGELDESFGGTGIASFELPASLGRGKSLVDLAVRPQGSAMAGRIVVAGHATTPANAPYNPDEVFVAQLLESGALDPAFGAGSGVSLAVTNASLDYAPIDNDWLARPAPIRLQLQSDGKILVAAETAETKCVIIIARLLAQGGLDPSFGAGGKVTLSDPSSSLMLGDLVVTDTDIFVLASKFARQNFELSTGGLVVRRLSLGGVEDASFAPETFAGVAAYGYRLLVASDGALLGAGAVSSADAGLIPLSPQPFRSVLVRFLPDAGLDPGFADGGVLVSGGAAPFYTPYAFSAAMATSDGYLAVGQGTSSQATYVTHVGSGGALDSTFGQGGHALVSGSTITPRAITPVDGGLLIVGNVGQSAHRFLMRADGTLDPTFVVPTYPLAERGGYPGQALAIDAKGRYLIPWASPEVSDGGSGALRIARFLL
jgi:uncharacterized delta-60 repeat protein